MVVCLTKSEMSEPKPHDIGGISCAHIDLGEMLLAAHHGRFLLELDALWRERTDAWRGACTLAAEHGRDAPRAEDFGVTEVEAEMRRSGAEPQAMAM
jgi:hypothetical protein